MAYITTVTIIKHVTMFQTKRADWVHWLLKAPEFISAVALYRQGKATVFI